MKNFYRNFNEEDLIVAYLYMSEHTGKIDDEMTEAIKQKFNYDEFVNKANNRTLFVKEKGRISFEVYNMVKKGDDLLLIIESISSDILNNQEREDFIILKFHEFSIVKENNKIDLLTIYKSLFGVFISSIIGFLFLWIFVLTTNTFSFFILVPVYIINYFVIRFITGKTRDNLIVFLAVFISVIASTLLSLLFFI